MSKGHIVLALLALSTTAALAHTGVKNPAVKARMHTMTSIGSDMKTLTQMAKGESPFDAATAQAAMTEIARYAAEIPALFEAPEDDPKSEAKPEIWTNFADFKAKSEATRTTAVDFSGGINTLDDVRAAAIALGNTCLACHELYREKQ